VSLVRGARAFLNRSGLLLWALPLGMFALFFFYPLFTILSTMFSRAGEIIPSAVWEPLLFTSYQALLSTLLTLLFGLPAAWVFSQFDFTGFRRQTPAAHVDHAAIHSSDRGDGSCF